MKGVPLTTKGGKRKLVRCLGWHEKDVWFKGSTYHRFCPACTSRRIREPNLPRAATPIRNVLYEDY